MSYFFTFDILIKSNTKSLTLSKVCPVSLDHLRERATNSKLQKRNVFTHVLEFFGWPCIENFPAGQCDIFFPISCLLANINDDMHPWINDFFAPSE